MASRGRSNFKSGRVRKFLRNPDAEEDEFGKANDELGLGATFQDDEATGEATLKRFEEADRIGAIDDQMGFTNFTNGPSRLGWMLNMRSVS